MAPDLTARVIWVARATARSTGITRAAGPDGTVGIAGRSVRLGRRIQSVVHGLRRRPQTTAPGGCG